MGVDITHYTDATNIEMHVCLQHVATTKLGIKLKQKSVKTILTNTAWEAKTVGSAED